MDGLEEMGKKAYQKQMWGAYEDAVSLYSDAIKRYPKDARLLNNRCLCYLEMKDFDRALDDAEHLILLFPNNRKSNFRKGEVLMYMKRYHDAVEAFKQVLKIDPECEDAKKQIMEARILELSMRVKCPKRNVVRAVRMSNSVEEAETWLKSGKLDALLEGLTDIIYYSDEEKGSDSEHDYDPFLDPSNPLGCTSLWVGNLTKGVSEQTLKNIFGKYGQIRSIRVLNQFAFINFLDSLGPGKAMKKLQGSIINGKAIIIKFPDNATGVTKKIGKLK